MSSYIETTKLLWYCQSYKYTTYFHVGDSTNRTEGLKSNKSAALLYEDTQPPTATKDDVYYEDVVVKSVQSEEIELSSNVAYGRVQRWTAACGYSMNSSQYCTHYTITTFILLTFVCIVYFTALISLYSHNLSSYIFYNAVICITTFKLDVNKHTATYITTCSYVQVWKRSY